MKSFGIVAEYNPFHKGHLYQINETKKYISEKDNDEAVAVAVMSGNLTQRGEAAAFNKWKRAEMAAACGVDLVVELPTVYACSSAGDFAAAGIKILENLGVDYISFGSESGDIEQLKRIANLIKENEDLIESAVKAKVKDGLSYPRARQEALSAWLNEEEMELMGNPNNILALEYLKNISRAHPLTIKRAGAGYNDAEAKDGLASASFIRKKLEKDDEGTLWMPPEASELIAEEKSCTMDMLYPLLVHKVISSSAEKLESVAAGGEGLGNKLKNSIRKCSSYDELVDMLKSKRYTRTRISRFLAHVLLDIHAEDIEKGGLYIRVLAFTGRGAKYLKKVKKEGQCQLPVITNINKDVFPEVNHILEKDIMAADIYNLVMKKDLYECSEFVQQVRRL